MSDSGGGKRIEALTVAGFAILVALGLVALVYSVGLLNGEQSERRQNYPHTHSETAKQKAERACVGSDPTAVFECVVGYVEASEDTAYTEQDLTAQQRAAWGALIAAFAGILSVGASILGLYWIKGTLEATRDAAAEAKRHADLAENSANNIERPYLFPAIQSGPIFQNTGFPIQFGIKFQNFGRTPAKIIRIGAVGFKLGQTNRETNLVSMKNQATRAEYFKVEAVVAPGDSTAQRTDYIVEAPLDANDAPPPREETVAYVATDYEYADFSGKKWHSFAVFAFVEVRGYFFLIEQGDHEST